MRKKFLLQPILLTKRLLLSKKVFSIFSLVLLTLSLLISCKKENTDINNQSNPDNERLISKVKLWLDDQKSGLPDNLVTKIDSLKASLDFNELRLEQYRNSEEFIVVPISDKFKSKNNRDKSPVNYLVVELKAQDTISKGNIIQYISANDLEKAPQNTFFKIFTYKDLDYSGQFTVLDVTGNFQYELKYENGKLKSITEQSKRTAAKSSPGRVNGCTDWYLITTYYYTDGTTSTTEEYLFTQCDDPCNETRNINGRSFRTNCGGGSGGNNIEYQYAISRPWKWDVYTTPDWWAESYESVTGSRNSSEPQGGHFTNISHNSSYFVTALPGYTWQELGNTPSIDNPQTVYSSVTGKAIRNGLSTVYSGHAYKSFSEMFGFSSQ